MGCVGASSADCPEGDKVACSSSGDGFMDDAFSMCPWQRLHYPCWSAACQRGDLATRRGGDCAPPPERRHEGIMQRVKRSTYPEPYYSRMAGRDKQVLGDLFGLKNFGVNRTTIRPGGTSALRHWHTRQDEFVYILSGTATLVMDGGKSPDWMRNAMRALAGVLPNATYRTVAGQTHMVKPNALAPPIIEFFRSGAPTLV